MREVALHILDICQNSVTAKADFIHIGIDINEDMDLMVIIIKDNGCGMNRDLLKRVTSPFTTTRTTRKVGLGIPLFKAGCEATGGSFLITSAVNIGTTVRAEYHLSHIDRPPLGELAETLHLLFTGSPEINFVFECTYLQNTFDINTKEIKDTLQGVPLNNSDVSVWLLEYIRDGLKELFGGKQI
jgi:hypothetical protein